MDTAVFSPTLKIEAPSVHKEPPFQSLFQALVFFRTANPARQKSLNLLEPESRGGDDFETKTGLDKRDAWAAVCLAIKAGLVGLHLQDRRIFELFHLDDRVSARAGLPEIARAMRMTEKEARRRLNRARDQMTDMLFRRGIIPEPPKWE